MLTARSQPIMHTEYLQPLDPLPTTLDAKKSPLALLAQTCSSIGKPDLPLNTADAKTPSTPHDSRCGKTSPEKGTVAVTDEKPYDPFKTKRDDISIGKSFVSLSKESHHRNSPSSESKPIASATAFPSRSVSPLRSRSEHSVNSTTVNTATDTIPSHSTGINNIGCSSLHSDSSHHSGKELKSHSVPIQSSHVPVLPPHLTSPGLYYKPGQAMMFPSSHSCGCSSQLASHYSHLDSALVLSAAANKSDSNPLVAPGYARVKTADGATTLMPICRDPYCTNCQASQTAASATSSCTQCRHDSYPLPGAVPLAFPLPGAPFPACPLPTSLASSPTAGITPYLYPSFGTLPTPAQTEHGHVCNWVSGSTNCGKRFASSEELLQHLRTHTQPSSEPSSYTASDLAASLNAQLSAYYMYYPTAAPLPGSLGFPKPFPSALSPNSALRYYPYKPPMSATPGLTAVPGLPAAYYSPYALHDMKSRLTSAVLPH